MIKFTSVALLFQYVCAWEKIILIMLILLRLPELIGVFKGAQPHIYHDTQDNHNSTVPNYNTVDHHCILRYLDDIYLMGLNLEPPTGLILEVPNHNELPWRPPSHTSTEKLESDHDSYNNINDEEAALMFQDWSSD